MWGRPALAKMDDFLNKIWTRSEGESLPNCWVVLSSNENDDGNDEDEHDGDIGDDHGDDDDDKNDSDDDDNDIYDDDGDINDDVWLALL